MTKPWPAPAALAAPLGSGVRAKSRIERYFASFVVAAPRRGMHLVNARQVPPGRGRASCIATNRRAGGSRDHLYADAARASQIRWFAHGLDRSRMALHPHVSVRRGPDR